MMYKEVIISLIIIISIFGLDFITQKYTDNTANRAVKDLTEIKNIIKQSEVDNNSAISLSNEKYDKWMKYHKTLAFYIEHNELEKVETNFVTAKSYIESEQYEDAISELDKTVYILQHIHEKYSMDWKNIF